MQTPADESKADPGETTPWAEMKADLERGLFKTRLPILGLLAAGLLLNASFFGTVADDARAAFWHTLNTDAGLRTFWPHGALFTALFLLVWVYAALTQLIGAAAGSVFLYRLWKRK